MKGEAKGLLFGRHSHPTEADLSAYLDAQLPADAKQRCEAHVGGCAPCRETLDSLSAVRSSLRALPRAKAQRSFRLRPAQVEAAQPARRSLLVQAMPLLSGVSVVSLVAFLTLVGVNASGGGGDSRDSAGASVPSSASVQEKSVASGTRAEARNAQDAAAPSAATPSSQYNAAQRQSTPAPQGFLVDGRDDDATRAAEDAPVPATTSESTGDDSDNSNAICIAMAVAAAFALTSGGLAFAAWRRSN